MKILVFIVESWRYSNIIGKKTDVCGVVCALCIGKHGPSVVLSRLCKCFPTSAKAILRTLESLGKSEPYALICFSRSLVRIYGSWKSPLILE